MIRRLIRRSLVAALLLAANAATLAQGQAEPSAAPAPAPSPAPVIDTGPIPLPQRPLWELGIGLSGLRLPDYRGSDENHGYLLPFPQFIYRGKWLRADREGMRAMLFNSPRAKLDVSFSAGAPTRSSNAAREGMPGLAGNIEVGPSIVLTLDEPADKRWKFDLRLPLRGAISLQRSPRYVGTTFSPNLNLDVKDVGGGWNVGMLTGPLLADRRYQAYYYDVDPVYATAQRQAYSARGGYAGWQTLASASRQFGDAWFGAFVRHEALHGAVNQDSPLMRRGSGLTVGFGVTWVLKKSAELVPSSE